MICSHEGNGLHPWDYGVCGHIQFPPGRAGISDTTIAICFKMIGGSDKAYSKRGHCPDENL